jgi:hypothetical protein
MIDTRNITSFNEFARRVAESRPQIGNAYMGEVNFTEGLPDGITRCTMTVTAMADGLIKFAINTNKEPFQYECYTTNGSTTTEWSQGSSSATPLTDITYSELKALRDANSLVPGMRYRITDYDCVTFQDSVRALVNAPCPRVHPLGSSPRTSVVGG